MNRTFQLALVFQVVVGLVSATAAKAESEKELLELVRESHRSSRESIQTFSCRVEFTNSIAHESKPPVTQSCSSRYWFSPKAMRAKISENNQDRDFLWDNSIRKTVVRQVLGGQPTVSAGRDRYSYRHVMRCDPFVRGQLVFNLPNTVDFLSFEEILERATKIKKVERIRAGNKELIMVQLFFDTSKKNEQTATFNIYFDPNVNYLVRKVIASYPTHRWEEEVLDYKEHEQGLFFPEQVVGTSQLLPKKTKYSDSKTNFIDVQINRPLPEEIFNFKYPQGIILGDSIRGSTYKIDTDGNRISKETPFGHETPPPANEGSAQVFGTETQEEPRSASRWILPISLGILIAAGTLAFLRKRRKSAGST